jgi:hypothetical protein
MATDTFIAGGSITGTTLSLTSTNSTISMGGSTLLSVYPTTASLNVFAAGGNASVSGTNNASLGFGSLSALTSGGSNIAIGKDAGNTVTTASNTINIGNVGSNTSARISIGTHGTHTSCIIAGIQGVAPGGTPQMVIINPTTSQLGSQAITTSSQAKGNMYFSTSLSATTNFNYAAASTYYLLNLATTASGSNSSFTHNSLGRLTYTGSTTTTFLVVASCSLHYSLTTPRRIAVDLYKNGSSTGTSIGLTMVDDAATPSSLSLNGLVSLATNDYVELYTANLSDATAIRFVSIMVTLIGLP